MIGGGPQKITVEIGGKIAASLGASLRTAQMQVSSFGRNTTRIMNDAAIAGRRGFKGMLDSAMWQHAAAGAAGIGLALGGSIRAASTFQGVLTDIGKTAGASVAELQGVSREMLRLSGRNLTNLSATKLAEGVQDLVAQGLDLGDAVASIESLGRVATATNSDLLDVTKTGFQLQNALKIRPVELKATFDALAYAGKQGAFELKDMAQFMPTIAAAAGSLGIQGKQGAISLAAMMQMVRKDAPDAGQAATRLTDAMLKMTAPDAVKRFKKFGVDIEKVLNDAKARGVNPMEAALTELQRVTGGDVFKLSQIFGDKEAKLALMSLMKYRKEYEKLKAEAGGQAAAGTIDRDYQRSVETFAGSLAAFQNVAQRLGITIGSAVLPPLVKIGEVMLPLAEGIAGLAQRFPILTGAVVGLGAAFVGLVAVAPFVASFISMVGSIKLALAGLQLGAVVAGWAGAIGPAMAAIGAAITGPVGIAVLAIAGIGLALKVAYDKLPWFRAGVDAVMGRVRAIFSAGITAIRGAFAGFITYVGGAWKVLSGILTLNPARITEGFSQAFAGIKQTASSWLGWMDALWPGFAAGARAAFAGIVGIARQAWAAIMGGGLGQMISGIGQMFSGLVNIVRGVWGTIVGIFTLDAGRAVAGVRQAFSGLDQIGAGLLKTATGLGRLIVTGIVAGVQGIGTVLATLGQRIVGGLRAIGAGMVLAMAAAARSILATWRALPGRIVAGLRSLIGGVQGVFNRVVAFIRETPSKVANVGRLVIDAILNGLKARAGALFSWIGGTWDRITSMVGGGGDEPAATPSAPGPARTGRGGTYRGGQRSATPPGRALGGRVRAGFPYIVGEKRRELFVPGMDGTIIPRIAQPITASAIAALLSAQPVMAAAPSLTVAPRVAAPVVSMAATAPAPMVQAPAVNLAPQITAMAPPAAITMAAPAAPALPALNLAAPAAPPVNIQAPLPPPAPRPLNHVTINAPVTINATPDTNVMEIRRQVELAFADIQRELESAHRVLLND